MTLVEPADEERLSGELSFVFSLYVERCKIDGEENEKLGDPPPFIPVDNRAGS